MARLNVSHFKVVQTISCWGLFCSGKNFEEEVKFDHRRRQLVQNLNIPFDLLDGTLAVMRSVLDEVA